jgi:F0F1-type ATP synthase epsilon subunit
MTVLADGAEPARSIDLETARRAQQEAEGTLAALDVAAPEYVVARRALDQQTARVAAAAEKV